MVPSSFIAYSPLSTVALLSVSNQCVVTSTYTVYIQHYAAMSKTKRDQQTTWKQWSFVLLNSNKTTTTVPKNIKTLLKFSFISGNKYHRHAWSIHCSLCTIKSNDFIQCNQLPNISWSSLATEIYNNTDSLLIWMYTVNRTIRRYRFITNATKSIQNGDYCL